MEELHKALYKFWGQFSHGGKKIPAFPAGRVPENQDFPYITFEVIQGAFAATVVPTSFVWCQAPKDGSFNVQSQRAQIMEQIARAIPDQRGALLHFPGGAVLLKRNPAQFMSYYDPPEEGEETLTTEPVIGGRISCEMTCYIY